MGVTDAIEAQECRTHQGVTGGCQVLSVIEAEGSLTGDKWQKHPMWLAQRPLVPWASVTSGEGTSGILRVLIGFSCSYCEYREDQLSTLPGTKMPLHCGIVSSWRPASDNCYQDSALAAVSHQLRLCNAHPWTNSLTGEPRSAQQDPLTLQQPQMATARV